MRHSRYIVYSAILLSLIAASAPAATGRTAESIALWQLVGIVGAACSFIFGVVFWAVRVLIKTVVAQFKQIVNERDSNLKDAIGRVERILNDDRNQVVKLEKDILKLRAELPEKYVMRGEYIRTETNFHLKIDRLVELIHELRG